MKSSLKLMRFGRRESSIWSEGRIEEGLSEESVSRGVSLREVTSSPREGFDSIEETSLSTCSREVMVIDE